MKNYILHGYHTIKSKRNFYREIMNKFFSRPNFLILWSVSFSPSSSFITKPFMKTCPELQELCKTAVTSERFPHYLRLDKFFNVNKLSHTCPLLKFLCDSVPAVWATPIPVDPASVPVQMTKTAVPLATAAFALLDSLCWCSGRQRLGRRSSQTNFCATVISEPTALWQVRMLGPCTASGLSHSILSRIC